MKAINTYEFHGYVLKTGLRTIIYKPINSESAVIFMNDGRIIGTAQYAETGIIVKSDAGVRIEDGGKTVMIISP